MSDTDTLEQARIASIEDGLTKAGEPLAEPQVTDYFAFEDTENVFLPDGTQFVTLQVLNEGQKSAYQNDTNRDVTIARSTGDAKMRMAPGDERHSLLRRCIVGWKIFKDGKELPFIPANLTLMLQKFPPKVIEKIEKSARRMNPWLLQEMTVADIDEQIKDLTEMREVKVREEAGNDSSSGA